jgi:HPt (histidine-containing phosphotransfer) domain-containing protein
MDIHIPVMNGLEAASKIAMLDSSIPIVAITANITAEDRKLYRLHNMPECLGKPFTTQDFRNCLLKYFTPVKWNPEDAEQEAKADKELSGRIINMFVRDSAGKYNKIIDAINNGETELACMITHSLKGDAGFLGKTALQKAASDAEILLRNRQYSAASPVMGVLHTELERVLAELRPLAEATRLTAILDKRERETALELLERLETLLVQRDTECLALIGDLLALPGSETLVRSIENFDFVHALQTLESLRESWSSQQ